MTGVARFSDPYVDEKTLDVVYKHFSDAKLSIRILTSQIANEERFKRDLEKMRVEGINIEIRKIDKGILHDRYFIDDKHFWLSGNSLNNLGKRKLYRNVKRWNTAKHVADIQFSLAICYKYIVARISPKEISGANGKFLPKPLLFHLRHPNSKTDEPKFWQILSPKNSFAKTSSALFRHLPEYLEGRTPKEKHPFHFQKKFHPAKSEMQGVFFFRGCRDSARQWRNDTSVRGSFEPPRAPRVPHHLFWK